MIEAVGTYSIQTSPLKQVAQSAEVVSASAPVEQVDLGGSRIRVDNLRDIAILEYVSGNGDVIRQYPSEQQIRAFHRAQQSAPQPAPSQSAAPAPQTAASAAPAVGDGGGDSGGSSAPAPASVSGGGGDGGASAGGHSVVV